MICLSCGLDSEVVSEKMPRHLISYDNIGIPHWVDCEGLKRHKQSFPELYKED